MSQAEYMRWSVYFGRQGQRAQGAAAKAKHAQAMSHHARGRRRG